MAHAEKCPICLGEGIIYKVPETITGIFTRFLVRDSYKKTCYGCGGKGWVEMQDAYSTWVQNNLITDYQPPYLNDTNTS